MATLKEVIDAGVDPFKMTWLVKGEEGHSFTIASIDRVASDNGEFDKVVCVQNLTTRAVSFRKAESIFVKDDQRIIAEADLLAVKQRAARLKCFIGAEVTWKSETWEGAGVIEDESKDSTGLPVWTVVGQGRRWQVSDAEIIHVAHPNSDFGTW